MNEKKKMKGLPKRILSFVLTLAMVFGLMPAMTVSAAENPDDYLTFTNTSDDDRDDYNLTIYFKWERGDLVQYRTYDGDSWSDWSDYSQGTSITVEPGHKVSFRGKEVYTSEDYHFSIGSKDGNCAISGDIMSLIYGFAPAEMPSEYKLLETGCYEYMFSGADRSGKEYYSNSTVKLSAKDLKLPNHVEFQCYRNMFAYCEKLTEAPVLPATELISKRDNDPANFCYEKMFYHCTALTKAPALPATVLAERCYDNMFAWCKKLTEAPATLPATTLAEQCYQSMFLECNSLVNLPSLPATTLASGCYSSMFEGCTELTTVPEDYLKATTLADNCYESMFRRCRNLTSLPNLPATTLANNCYNSMFYSCTKLTAIPENYLPATTLANNCYNSMFNQCSSLVALPKLPVTAMAAGCYQNMFNRCTALTAIPENYLPATTLANNCYNSMFYGCTNIASVPATLLPASEMKNSCYREMFRGCSKITAAPTLSATTVADYCYYGMFYGCTTLAAAPALPATTLANSCYQQMFYGCTTLTTVPALPATTLASNCYNQMFTNCSNIVIKHEKTDDYARKWRIPATASATSWNNQMFANCNNVKLDAAGTLKAPDLNTAYYILGTHTHEFTYTCGTGTDANKVIATCANTDEGCDIPEAENEHKIVLSLTATSQNYSGSAVTASFVDSDKTAWTTAGLTVPDITYEYKATATGTYAATTETKKAGYYKASATVDGKTAYVEYTINKVDAGLSNSPMGGTGLAYTGEAKNLLSTAPTSDSAKAIKYYIATTNTTTPVESAFTATTATATNAGKYYVYYLLEGDENHNNKIGGPIEVTIAKADQTSIASPTATADNIKATKITLTAIGTGHGATKYAKSTTSTAPIAESAWQDSAEFTGLTKNTDYYFFAKYVGDDNYNEKVSTGTKLKTMDITETTLEGIIIKEGIENPGITYAGAPVTVDKIYTGTPKITGVDGTPNPPSHTWEGIAPTSYIASETAPTMPGRYKLTVTVESEEAIGTKEIQFKLAKANGPSAPTGLTSEPASEGGHDGKIKGLDGTKTYEYSTDDGDTWTDVTVGSIEITGLAGGNILVREKETDTKEAGEHATVLVKEKYAKPNAGIDYLNKKLTGLTAAAKYLIGTVEKTADSDGKLDIQEFIGTIINLVKMGNDTHANSDAQGIALSKPSAPVGLNTENVSAAGTSDGKITGLDNGKKYQYRKVGANSWTDVTLSSTEIAGLEEGKYEIRIAPSAETFEGVATVVSVKKTVANPEPTHKITGRVKDADNSSNYTDNLVVNIKKGVELIVSGKTKTIGTDVGCYEFDIPNGLYNIEIVSADGNRTITKMLNVAGSNVAVLDIVLPSATSQSKLTIDTTVTQTTTNEADYAASVVEGLDNEATLLKDANNTASLIKVEMKMTPQTAESVEGTAAQSAIDNATSSMDKTEFVDICVEKNIDGTITLMGETTTVFEVVIPYDFSGKSDVKIVRFHDNNAQEFNKLQARPASGSASDLKYYSDTQNGFIYLYTQKFSTYAIAYKNAGSTPSPTPGGSSGGGSAAPAKNPVTVPTVPNGKVTADKSTASKNEKVIITVTPDDGYTVDKISVTDKNGKPVELTDLGSGKYSFIMPDSKVTVDVTYKQAEIKEPEPEKTPEQEKQEEINTLALNAGLKVSQTGKGINVKWGKVTGADGYFVYASYCGQPIKKIKTIKNVKTVSYKITKLDGKALNLKKNYKVCIAAYKTVNGKNVTIAKTIAGHVVGLKNTKNTNAKGIKLAKSKYTLAVGKTATIKATTILVDKTKKQLGDEHAKEFRYASSDKSVATVTSTGKIKAKKAGKCTIYVYARNGYAKKVTVTVK